MNAPLFVGKGEDAPKPTIPFVERNAVVAVVFNPKIKKFLTLKLEGEEKFAFVTGGIDAGQSPEEAARAEIREETGYNNLKLISTLPSYELKIWHSEKKRNRHAKFQCFLFELTEDTQVTVSKEELTKHTVAWLSAKELGDLMTGEGFRYILTHIPNAFYQKLKTK